MSKIKAKFVNLDPNSLQANGDNIQVKVKDSNPITIEAGKGIALQESGVDTAYLKDGAVTIAKIASTNSPTSGQTPAYDETSQKVVWQTPASSDSKDVKVSANDATSGFLSSKIIGTSGKVIVSENNDGSNETLQISIGSNVFDKTSDTATSVPYSKSDWNGITTVGGALEDLQTNKATDSNVVHKTGAETIAGDKTFSGNTVLNGTLTINGTVTKVNSTEVSTGDNIIELNNAMTSGTPTADGGLKLLRGDLVAASFIWSESKKKWVAGLAGSETGISLEGHTHTKANITDFTETDYVHVTGAETINGVKTFGSIPSLPASDPVNDNDAVRKSYVDGKAEQKKVEVRALTAAEITAKQLTLASTPKQATAVELTPQGACEQIYGIDFTVTGTTLSWSGLGLDGVLAVSDEIVISYHF
jgi:hypothetical protein